MFTIRDILADLIDEEGKCKRLVTVKPGTSLKEVARKIIYGGVGAVLVVDEENKLVGIVTKRDIIRAILLEGLDPEKTPVDKIMVSEPITIRADTPIDTVIDIMNRYNISHLPIVEEGKVIGIVTEHDVANIVRELLDIVQKNQ